MAAHADACASPIAVGAGTTVIVNAHKPRKPPKLNKGRRRSLSLGRRKRKNRRSQSVDSQTPRRSSLKISYTSNTDHSSSNHHLIISPSSQSIRRPQQFLSTSYSNVSQTTLEELTAIVQRSRGAEKKKRLSPTTMEHLTAIVQRSTAEKKQEKQRRRHDKQQQVVVEPESPQPQDSPKQPRRRSSPPPRQAQPAQPKKSVVFGPVYVDFYKDKYHDKVPLNKKWYSVEDLKTLMDHEVKIILRYQMGKVSNGSKRVRENSHACLRGFEHIKEELDKNEHNRLHVLAVLRLQQELLQKQQQTTEKEADKDENEKGDDKDNDDEEDQDFDKQLMRRARKSSYDDRKKAYKAGLQDASDVLKDRKLNTKAMVANNSCTNSPIDTHMDKSYTARFLGVGMGSKSMRTGRTIPLHASSTNESSSSRLGFKIQKSMRLSLPMFSSSERIGSTRTRDTNTMPTITTTATITIKPKSAMSKSLRTDSTRRSTSKSSRKQRTMTKLSQSDRWDRADDHPLAPIDERQTKSMRSSRTTTTVTSTSEHPMSAATNVAPISEGPEDDQLTVTKLQRVGLSASSGDLTPVANNKDQTTMATTAAVLGAATTLTTSTAAPSTKPKKKKSGSKSMDNKSSSKSTRKQRTLSLSDHAISNSKDKKEKERKTSKSMRGPRTTATSLVHTTSTATTNSQQDNNDSKRSTHRPCMNDDLPPLVPIPGRMAK